MNTPNLNQPRQAEQKLWWIYNTYRQTKDYYEIELIIRVVYALCQKHSRPYTFKDIAKTEKTSNMYSL